MQVEFILSAFFLLEVLSQKFLNNRNSIANALNNSKLRKGKQKVAGRY